MRRKGTWLLVLLALVLFQGFILSIQVADALKVARVYVNPTTVTKGVGESFTVEIRVADAEDLFTYGFKLKWQGASMNCTKIEEGDFLSGGGVYKTFFIQHIYNGPDGTGVEADYLAIGNTLLAKPGVHGSGILATITFEVESVEGTAMDLYRVELMDSRGYYITLGVTDGYLNLEHPTLSVNPPQVINETLVVGDSFTVNVTISNVVDLLGLRFNMTYDASILNATQVTIPSFLTEPVIPWNPAEATWEIIRSHSTVRVDIYSNADPPVPVSVPVDANATVAEVTFQVVGTSPKGGKDGKGGESILYIYHSEIDDSIATTVKNHTPPTQNGYFSNLASKHDINVRRIVASPVNVNKGEIVFVNVTVKNAGGYEETFNLTLYYETSVESNIVSDQSNIAVQIGKETIQQFEWNTEQVKAGKYTLKAVASLAQDDNLVNNERIYETLITVEESSSGIDPMIIYAVVGVIVVVVVVGLVVWRFRKKP